MQEEGYIAKLLLPEGAKDVKLGEVVAIVVDNKDDVAKFKDYKLEEGETGKKEEKQAAPAQEQKQQESPQKGESKPSPE